MCFNPFFFFVFEIDIRLVEEFITFFICFTMQGKGCDFKYLNYPHSFLQIQLLNVLTLGQLSNVNAGKLTIKIIIMYSMGIFTFMASIIFYIYIYVHKR